MSVRVPARISWAVDVLAVEPHERILEIGCGRGIAIHAIVERLGGGRITGIDRSATAIKGAAANNAAAVRSRAVRLLNVALAEAALRGPFDKIFAINVNVFWIDPAKELTVVRRLLAPAGQLYLFYEPPSARTSDRARHACISFLEAAGWTVNRVVRARLQPHLGLCLIASVGNSTD